MDIQIDKIIDDYVSWLKDNISTKLLDDTTYEITTPFLDHHNDFIQIYLELANNAQLRLSDGGYTLQDLKSSGLVFDTPKRKSYFQSILNSRGVKHNPDNDELYVLTSHAKIPQKKHDLIQSILAIDDMHIASRSNVASFFLEDVTAFLIQNKVDFSRAMSIIGKSGLTQTFDFFISGSLSRGIPEKFIQHVSNPKADRIESLLFSWSDTREARTDPGKLFVFLDDRSNKVASKHIEALKQYEIEPVLWDQRESFLPRFRETSLS